MKIAGMVMNKQLPDSKEEFKKHVIDDVASIIDYPREDIECVFDNYNVTDTAEIMAELFKK